MQSASETAIRVARDGPSDAVSVFRGRVMLVAAVLCALFMIPIVWNMREGISTDGLSYLEIASNAVTRGLDPLLANAYWSPGYPAVVAVALKLFQPSRINELAVVHSLDWLIWLATCLCFTWFLAGLLRWIEITHGARCGRSVFGGKAGFLSFIAFVYTLLFIANLDQSLWYVGPNILMECMVFLAAAICIRLDQPDPRFARHAIFGVVLGLSYAVKAALFPLSAALLAMLFVRPVSRGGRKGVIVAAAAFLLTASPFVAYLSLGKGRLTFGDSGNLTYAWYVNGSPRSIPWQDTPASAALRHPGTRIYADPPILKIEGPYPATLPYWYDPSWWYDGVKAHFNRRQQISQYLRTVGLAPKLMLSGSSFWQLAKRWMALWPGLAVFALLGLRPWNLWRAMGRHVWLLLWPACALLMFATVLIEYRYVFPFLLLAVTIVFAAAWIATEAERAMAITLTVTAGLLLAYGHLLAGEIAQTRRPAVPGNREIAGRITAAGIRPGDRVATVGWPDSTYFVRLAGARVTIQMDVADPAGLATLPAERVRAILATLRDNGATALFAQGRPLFDNDSGWIRISDAGYVRPLR